jgi:acetyltransferase-like isoleucine patch superfamily enzyme
MILTDKNIFFDLEGNKLLLFGPNCDIGFATTKTVRMHAYTRIEKNVRLDCEEVGSYTFINEDVSIRRCKKIGNFCAIGSGAHIGVIQYPTNSLSVSEFFYGKKNWNWSNKQYDWENTYSKFELKSLIEIGNDVWIGANAIIMPGVKVGDGAIIASNAVVTKDVPPYAIVGGVPAHIIKYRFSENLINRLLELQWWQYNPEVVNGLNISHVNNELLEDIQERIHTYGQKINSVSFDFFPKDMKIVKNEKNQHFTIFDMQESAEHLKGGYQTTIRQYLMNLQKCLMYMDGSCQIMYMNK